MKCKKCGMEIPDGSVFCQNCGTNQNEPKKSKLTIVLIVIIAILVITIIVGGLFLTHVLCIHKWKNPDCTHPMTCSVCGKTQGLPIGHDFTEMTCTEDSVCTICGEIKEKAEGHKWTEATCTEDSVCEVCGEIGEKSAGHQWENATCTEPKKCSVCGKTEGKKAGHKWIDATCTEPKTCSVCGETEGEKADHQWIPATETAPKTCSICGETVGSKLEKTYSTSFSVYDIANSVGLYTGAHEILVIKNVSSNNGTATVSGISMWGTISADTINVTGCTKGTVVITGTISTLAQDTSSQGDFYFTMTGYAG